MRIKDVPEGSIIKCCGSTAQVLKRGELGTRVKVLTLKKVDYPGLALGHQIWSNDTDVEYTSGFDSHSKFDVSTQTGTKLPLNLF